MKEITSIERPDFGLFYTLILGVLLLLPTSLFAAGPVVRSGETVTVEAKQVLEGDFYGLGQTITLSGAAEHDVYVAGGSVTINAPVVEDLVILGGSAQVHGEVKDDVRIVAGEAVLAKPVLGDVVILGGTVRILSTATIGGDLIFLGGDVTVDGPVTGSVYGTSGKVRINAHVGGDVDVRVGESFTLGDAADVAGKVSYKGQNELVRAQGAVVGGTITRESVMPKATMTTVQSIVLDVLILIFSSLTIFFIARERAARLVAGAWSAYGRSGLIGLGMLLAIPIVAIILMASMVGIMVGFALIFLYLLFLGITFMLLPIFLGTFLERLIRGEQKLSLITVVLGIALFTALPFIPFIGSFIILLTVTVVFGSLCLELYRIFRSV